MTRKVDFFIVGAPKCGTTALALNLNQNPAIVISEPKEPHYFASDLQTGGVIPTDDAGYLARFFPKEKPESTLWGDASVWHMYSEVALKRIRDHNPKARIVAVVRDPARAAFSLHQQMIFQQQEDTRSFEAAWKKSDLRYAREEFPDRISLDPRLVAYKHAYAFHAQLMKVCALFPPEQILILRQEELNLGQADAVRRVADFIGAAPYTYKVERTNETFYVKFPFVTDLMRSPLVRGTTIRIKKLLGIKTLGIGRPSEPFRTSYGETVHRDLAEDIAAVERDFGITLKSNMKT